MVDFKKKLQEQRAKEDNPITAVTSSVRPDYIKPIKKAAAVLAPDSSPGVQKLGSLAAEFKDLKDRKEQHEDQLKEINKDIDALSQRIADLLESAGLHKISVDGVGTVSVEIKNRPTVNEKDQLIAWLDNHKMSKMAPRTVHPQSLLGLVNELLEQGNPLPDGVANFQQKRAALRRSSTK